MLTNNRPSFCFISFTGRIQRPILDPSTRYRSYHPADELRKLGCFSVVYSQKFFEEPNFGFDVYVFHRPSRNHLKPEVFDSVIEQLKRLNKVLIADYDDLIFGDEQIAENSSIVKNKRETLENAINIFKNNLGGLLAFDKVMASTSSLAKQVKRFNPKAEVAVLPNFIPSTLLEIYKDEAFYLTPRPRGSIGYFSGTKSHDKDILVVLEALHRVLIENPDFTLLVVGPVEIPAAFAALPNVITNPVVNYLRLPSLMKNCETVIAPLETGFFNDCKSRVKFLEAALSGCRLIASPITDMKEIGRPYLELAETKGQWYELLSTLPNPYELETLRIQNFKFLEQNCQIEPLLTLAGVSK